MENPFKKLVHPPKEAPPEMKKHVMNDISAFKLFVELGSLFSFNYAKAAEAFFKKNEHKNKK
ncbi:hypothetical protein [Ulvibacter antarcticus]|uniref:Uncharacterized protein n=1 Tax=Ulvibacter antarcticus TaxID=442714 RepID=A0A3L9YD70_9FLAO|nr:hypothetical protein [Ulvibacter antarcticus]RMA58601.1 hypothetical protein BXY75_1974 [Ulvibacter antarcticus]